MIYRVTLQIDTRNEGGTDPPGTWDWATLLDMGDEDVSVISSEKYPDPKGDE